MINGSLALEVTPPRLLFSHPGDLTVPEVAGLWEVVLAVHCTWGAKDIDPLTLRSQWLEFITTRTAKEPSYVEEYRSGLRVVAELLADPAGDPWERLFFAHGSTDLTNRLGHLRKFVVEEFIAVWRAVGGFRTYGADNYNGYVSGSRFAVVPSYRRVPPVTP